MGELVKLMASIGRWVNNGSRETTDKAVKVLAISYRNRIRSGLNADNSKMASLEKSTIDGPIRREGKPTLRSTYGNTPMSASGATADSIQAKRINSDTWEIAPSTSEAAKILNSNAKASHSGQPFYGDTRKPVRDPLTVEDPQLDLIEDQILQDLTRVLGI